MNTTEFGMGCLPDPEDSRDFKAEAVFGAVQADWSKPTNIVPVARRNQGISQSCVGQGCSYKHDLLQPSQDIFSARDLYAQIHLPGGGAYIRDGILRVVKYGQARRSEVPEPEPQTESSMTSLDGITPQKEQDDREADGYVLPHNDIEYTAWAVQNFKAVVLGVYGTHEGWVNKEFPRPPKAGDSQIWGHCLCAIDLVVIDGKKYIKCASSWSVSSQEYHYLGEEYFKTSNVFNPWVIIPRKESMTNSIIVKKGAEYGIYDPATSPDGLITLMRNRGIEPPLNQDGTLNFSEVDKLVGGQVV